MFSLLNLTLIYDDIPFKQSLMLISATDMQKYLSCIMYCDCFLHVNYIHFDWVVELWVIAPTLMQNFRPLPLVVF